MKESLLAAGGIVGAVAASSCCVVPLVFVSVGVSGAWIGNLTALAAYQPLFMALAVACLGTGFWLVYRPARGACAAGPGAASRAGHLVRNVVFVKTALWLGTAIVAVTVGADYGGGLFL